MFFVIFLEHQKITGRQGLEIIVGDEHMSFTTSKIGLLININICCDPDNLRNFYYSAQDMKYRILLLLYVLRFSELKIE